MPRTACRHLLLACWALLVQSLAGCGSGSETEALFRIGAAPLATPVAGARGELPPQLQWHIQYSGMLEIKDGVELVDIDLFDTSAPQIAELHRRGLYVVCYFSAGSYEDWRPDAASFPVSLLGKDLAEWPGERWLDVTHLDLIMPILENRLDLAVEKGCDGVDPDNVDGYQNDSGFSLQPEDQLSFNIELAEAAHSRSLAIGLKNDLEQIPALVSYFDWAMNEECFSYDECDLLMPFVQAGKPVFIIEYALEPEVFCPQARQFGVNALLKAIELDAYSVDCSGFLPTR